MKALKTLASLALLGCSSLALAAPVEGSDTTMNRLAGLHSEFDSELDGIEHRRGTRRVTSTRRVTVRTSSARPPARPSSRPPSRPSSRPAAIPGHAPRPPARPATRPPTRTVVVRQPAPSPRTVVVRQPAYRPPARTVVVHRAPPPQRPATVVVAAPRRPAAQPRVVVAQARPTHVRPWHGVFVYGPRPTHHTHYHQQPKAEVQPKHMPDRKVARANTLGVGLRMGSLVGGYKGGDAYGDFGVGIVTRYRPVESVGLELAVSHYNQTFNEDTERANTSGQLSGNVFLFPWSKVSPYVTGGVTLTGRHVDDEIEVDGTTADVDGKGLLFGPHGGVGLEFALGKNFALDLDARYVHYLNGAADGASFPGQLQANAGLMLHF